MNHAHGPIRIEHSPAGIFIWDDDPNWHGRAPRLVCKIATGDIERDVANAKFIKTAFERAGKEGA